MDVFEKYNCKEIEYLKSKNEVMRCITSNDGFFKLYQKEFIKHKDSVAAYKYCNSYYFLLFLHYRFKCYEDFAKEILGENNSSVIARTLLLKWFKSNGFSSFESFKPVVQIFYPEITTEGLLSFWNGQCIEEKVLERVNHTYQILF